MNQEQQSQRTITVFNGTRKTVFDQMGFLVKQLGNPLLSKDLVARDVASIAKRHSIQDGDLIPYITSDGDFAVLGYNIDPDVSFDPIVYLFGSLTNLAQESDVAVEFVDLSDNDANLTAFRSSIDQLKRIRADIESYFSHITVVQATPDELFGLVNKARSEMSVDFESEQLTVLNINDLSGTMFDVSTISEIVPGVALMGEVGLDEAKGKPDEKRELLFVGHALETTQLIEFLTNMVEGMGVGLFLGFHVSITSYLFEEYMQNTIIHPD